MKRAGDMPPVFRVKFSGSGGQLNRSWRRRAPRLSHTLRTRL